MCVPYFLCDSEGVINVDGSFLFDEQRDQPPVVLKSCPVLEICCKRANYIPAIRENICNGGIPTPSKCGFRNKEGLGGLNDGKKRHAKYAEFPWVVAILNTKIIGGFPVRVYSNVGSLIHPKVVLTAAHLVVSKDQSLIARAGEWDSQNEVELCAHEDRKVQNVIVHSDFVRANLQNDLALLILDTEFVLTPFVNTICLPPHQNTNFDNQRCIGAGWGKDKLGIRGVHSAVLKKVELPVIPSESCENMLSRTRLGENFKLHNGFLCAGKF